MLTAALPAVQASAATSSKSPFITVWNDNTTRQSGISIDKSQMRADVSLPTSTDRFSPRFKTNNVNYLNDHGYTITADQGKKMIFKISVGNVKEESVKDYKISVRCRSDRWGEFRSNEYAQASAPC